MSSPPEILSDQKIFHRWQPSPFEYFLVCHFVHPGYPRRIMKACSFFTCRLYTVQASAPYRRVDSTIARYILPLTRMDTWWLFQSLWRSRPKDTLALAILLCISSSMHPSLDIGEIQNRVQRVSINRDMLISGYCRVGLVQHHGLRDINLQAELL